MFKVRDIVPHSGEMVLVENIVSHSDDSIVAVTVIRESSPFYRPGSDPVTGGVAGVPSWVGLEYMAQTVAAWSGLREREQGGAPRSGFLIGVKRYTASKPVFPTGSRLEIEARVRDRHGSLAVFECRISAEEIEVEAVLNVVEGELMEES